MIVIWVILICFLQCASSLQRVSISTTEDEDEFDDEDDEEEEESAPVAPAPPPATKPKSRRISVGQPIPPPMGEIHSLQKPPLPNKLLHPAVLSIKTGNGRIGWCG